MRRTDNSHQRQACNTEVVKIARLVNGYATVLILSTDNVRYGVITRNRTWENWR